MSNENLIEDTFAAIMNEVDGWEYEEYEGLGNRVAHRSIRAPWGYVFSYQVIADEGQINHERVRRYFDTKTRESIEHFIGRGFIS